MRIRFINLFLYSYVFRLYAVKFLKSRGFLLWSFSSSCILLGFAFKSMIHLELDLHRHFLVEITGFFVWCDNMIDYIDCVFFFLMNVFMKKIWHHCRKRFWSLIQTEAGHNRAIDEWCLNWAQEVEGLLLTMKLPFGPSMVTRSLSDAFTHTPCSQLAGRFCWWQSYVQMQQWRESMRHKYYASCLSLHLKVIPQKLRGSSQWK